MASLADPDTFKSAWMDGLVHAYGRLVRPVPEAYGVMSTQAPEPGRVSVVIGGGCGHYPAFAGLVGPGLADAAVVGDVFTSPSAEQVYRTARAVDGGAGVLFSYGNYAGDVMHFGLAARRLAAEGTETRTVCVTDDVASGPSSDTSRRRGVAGGFFVFKIAAAAAQRGYSLARVTEIARKADAMTRTFGAAFNGCTLPGQTEALFTVDPGHMELGMGIHGEAGVRTAESMPPDQLADLLADTLLAELPASGGRVALLLNGLGSTSYEDLFICYAQAHRRFAAAGFEPHRSEVGEFVTSLDMAGLSLSVLVLDKELADLYDAPCETPAFTSATPAPRHADGPPPPVAAIGPTHRQPSSQENLPSGRERVVVAALSAARDAVTDNERELGRLDAVAGDGDHGQGVVRGMRAAVAAARGAGRSGAGARPAGEELLLAGTAMADAAGGASGALYGVLLTEIGAGLLPAEDQPVTLPLLASAVDRAFEALRQLGGGELGEKTMLDAVDPFRSTLLGHAQEPAGLATAWSEAATAAEAAARATADLTPQRGRAARLGVRGVGSPDPGATSFALMVGAVADLLETHCPDAGPTPESG